MLFALPVKTEVQVLKHNPFFLIENKPIGYIWHVITEYAKIQMSKNKEVT